MVTRIDSYIDSYLDPAIMGPGGLKDIKQRVAGALLALI